MIKLGFHHLRKKERKGPGQRKYTDIHCTALQCGVLLRRNSPAVCCSVLRCVAVCCSVSQCVAVCFSMLLCPRSVPHATALGSITATQCNTLQHTATQCNTPQHCNTLYHIETHCNTLQHTVIHLSISGQSVLVCVPHTSALARICCCNTLQHTTAHSSTLQHTATHCNTPQHTATRCNTL